MEPPDEFPFPYTPYPGQKAMMSALYRAIESGACGVFESPTGTGKTMSLLCGSLKWLVDKEEAHKNHLASVAQAASISVDTGKTQNWFEEQTCALKMRNRGVEAKKELDNVLLKQKEMAELPQKLKSLEMERAACERKRQYRHLMDVGDDGPSIADPSVLEDELESEAQAKDLEVDTEKPVEPDIKIIYASRTHSQLAQVVDELKKSPFSNSIRMTILASRLGTCINPNVNKLPNLQLVNDKCKELREEKSSSKRCPYIQNPISNEVLKVQSLLSVMDIEDLVKSGRKVTACPYYASRNAMENAQLILVPYNTLLHLETREASGLDLKNSVVIVDESHNLLDTVREIYSQEVFGYQLLHAHAQITHYITHRAKTASSDTICVYRQLLSILSALLRILGGNSRTPETLKMDPSGMFMKLHTFLSETAIGNIGLLKLLDECNKRKLAILLHAFTTQQKLTLQGPTKEPKQSNISKFLQNLKTTEGNKPTVKSGFVKKRNMKKGLLPPSAKTALATKQQEPPLNSESTQYLNPNAIRPVLALLKLLVSSTDDSEIMIIKASTFGQSCIKYVLLNPAAQFGSITQNARSVILAGGTMSPLSEFTDQLLQGSGVPKSKITCFTTDHVVPPENICPLILPIGSSGQDLEFTHQKKNQPHLMLELGQTLLDLMALVPAGMVIFLPSYEYKEMLAKCWTSEDIFEKMSRTKKLFFEPRQANLVKTTLEEYEKENFSGAGAALFAVVGGKMSEGINFKDDMGRCVVVVGLPYANLHSNNELRLRMQYLDKKYSNIGPSQGELYYEALCMKQVNQCIGRAVRHIGDYASMVLLDTRYRREKTKQSLPMWVRKQLQVCDTFQMARDSLAKFYSSMRPNQKN